MLLLIIVINKCCAVLSTEQTLIVDGYYRAHHHWLQGWLERRLSCSAQAADLAHDTFVRLMKQAIPDVQTPRAFLSQIAKSVLIDHYRRRSIEDAYLTALAALPEPTHPSPESRALLIELLSEIDAMLDGLPGKVRQAFLLVQLDGLSYAEVAEQMGCSTHSIKKYMARALAQCLLLEASKA